MSKFRKAKSYVVGAVKHPRTLIYYVSKMLKYGNFGYADELLYWKKELSDKPSDYSQDMQVEDIRFAVNEVKQTFGVSGRELRCLELGAGPRSRLTRGYDEGLFDLVAVDPLAEEFRDELGGRDFLKRGRGEDLSKLFKPESFHMVYASNAIDHGDDPERILSEVDSVLKPSGVLIICGNSMVADHNNWLGLHQHNLWISDDELHWQNKEMKSRGESRTIVDHRRYLCLRDYTRVVDGDDMFMGVWVKFR